MSPDVQQAPSTGSSELPDSDDDDSEWEDHGDVAVCPAPSSSAVYVQDSSDVQLGPRTVIQGSVTINQHVTVDKNKPVDLGEEAFKTTHFVNGFVHQECKSATPLEKERKWLPCRTQTLFWILLGVAVLMSVVAVITVYSLQSGSSHTSTHQGRPRNLPTISPISDPDPNRTLSNRKKIFSKEQWGGYGAKSATRLIHPTKYVVISHTAGNTCFDSTTCSAEVRTVQDVFFAQDVYDDIGYNFLVGGDGNVYEGRGWDVVSMHSGFVDKQNIAVCFLGHFVKYSPTYDQVESAKELIELGVKLGKLDKNYKVVSHNQTYNTLSPGPNIYKIISQWPHFYVPSADDPA